MQTEDFSLSNDDTHVDTSAIITRVTKSVQEIHSCYREKK